MRAPVPNLGACSKSETPVNRRSAKHLQADDAAARGTAISREYAPDGADLIAIEKLVEAGLADIARGDFTPITDGQDARRLLDKLNARVACRG